MTQSRLAVLPFSFPRLDPVGCAFTTRLPLRPEACPEDGSLALNGPGSREAVLEQRELLRRQLGFDCWREVRQVHGTEMVFDAEGAGLDPLDPPQADALATTTPGRALLVKVADCQPVLLAHRSGRFIAALHVGWRANRADAPRLWTERFCREYGLRPEELLAVRGPSLGPGRSEFINFEAEWGRGFAEYFDPETRCLDLWRLTRDQLLTAGIRTEHIFSLDLCTASLPELFFSHRRSRDRGRQGGLIWIRSS